MMPSPDLLQHTQNVISLNSNILSPTDSQRSHCSTPAQQEEATVQKQGSPFYAEPADSLSQSAVPKRLLNRNMVPVTQRHSNPPALLSPGMERVESIEFNGLCFAVGIYGFECFYITKELKYISFLHFRTIKIMVAIFIILR